MRHVRRPVLHDERRSDIVAIKLAAARVGQPNWFDWLALGLTIIAASVPAVIAIVLWRSDRRALVRARRDAAAREFTHLLAAGDPALVRFRDFGYFANAMGPGADGLLGLIWTYMEWDTDMDGEDPASSHGDATPAKPELRLDLSVDVSAEIHRWQAEPTHRADLTEVYLANGKVFPEPEDNRIISPGTRRAAEDLILKDSDRYREWLAGTRLSPRRIRLRRFLGRFGTRVKHEPLNPLATDTNLEEDVLPAGDDWLRERTTAELD